MFLKPLATLAMAAKVLFCNRHLVAGYDPGLEDHHDIQPGNITFVDDTGSEITVDLLEGDLILTFSQVENFYGSDFAEELSASAFRFLPPEYYEDEIYEDSLNRVADSLNRATDTTVLWPRTYLLDDVMHIPYEIGNYDATLMPPAAPIIEQALAELEQETHVLRFIDSTQYQALINGGATIPNHFFRFIQAASCSSVVGQRIANTGCVCATAQCGTCQNVNLLYNPGGDTCFRTGLTGIIKHGKEILIVG